MPYPDIFTVRWDKGLPKGDKVMNTCALPQANPNTQNLTQFYQENLKSIYQFVYVHVKNREVAEDLTSQVFLKAVRHLDSQRSSQSIRSWLFQIAHTTLIDYWRAFYRAPTNSLDALLETGWEIPNEDASFGMNNSEAQRVERILQQLPKRYREVLTYRFLVNMTVNEIAQIMGVTEANVRILQFRALHRAATLESATIDGD